MHILVIPSEYPTSDHKLGGIFVKEQLNYLKKKNKIGIIYVYLFSIKKLLYLFHNIFLNKNKKNNQFIFYWPRIPKIKILNYFFHNLFVQYYFKKYVKLNGYPDIIHAHFSEFAGYSSYNLNKKYKIPYIITEHSTDFIDNKIKNSYFYNKSKTKLIKKIFNNASKIISVSRALDKNIFKYFSLPNSKRIVIPNTSLNIKNLNRKKKFDFIFVGSLDKRKNPILLLHAFKELNYHKKYSLLIVGDGPLNKECNNFIKMNNLQNKVKIFKNCKRTKVLNLIDKSKVLILTSKHETFGVVLIEALSLGVPVITTNSGGISDIVKKSNGVILKTFTSSELSREMIKTVNKKYNKRKIIQYYKKNFSPQIVTNQLQNLYRKINK